jgi:hypothetical protein
MPCYCSNLVDTRTGVGDPEDSRAMAGWEVVRYAIGPMGQLSVAFQPAAPDLASAAVEEVFQLMVAEESCVVMERAPREEEALEAAMSPTTALVVAFGESCI